MLGMGMTYASLYACKTTIKINFTNVGLSHVDAFDNSYILIFRVSSLTFHTHTHPRDYTISLYTNIILKQNHKTNSLIAYKMKFATI